MYNSSLSFEKGFVYGETEHLGETDGRNGPGLFVGAAPSIPLSRANTLPITALLLYTGCGLPCLLPGNELWCAHALYGYAELGSVGLK